MARLIASEVSLLWQCVSPMILQQVLVPHSAVERRDYDNSETDACSQRDEAAITVMSYMVD